MGEPLEARLLLTTFTVTNVNDSGPGSFRQAIADANATAGADTISFSGSLFADATPDSILLTSGRITISDDLFIQGGGANLLTITAAGQSQLLALTGATTDVTIEHLTLSGGNAGGSTFSTESGGAIHVDNAGLTLRQVTLSGNSATLDGGAVYNATGTVNVIDSFFTGNVAVRSGGGLATNGQLNVTGSTLTDNNARLGGAIVVGQQGVLDLQASSLIGNSAGNDGSGVYNYFGTATVQTSLFQNNTSGSGGPVTNRGSLVVTDSTFVDNFATYGGGIANSDGGEVVVSGSTFRDNIADLEGGGILNAWGGTVTIIDSTFTGNWAGLIGGAVGVVRGSTVRIQGTTMADNGANRGGAITNTHDSVVEIVNSTISGNRADEAGGGIFNNGDLTVTNSTIVSNRSNADGLAGGGGGGIYTHNRTSVQTHLFNTIIAGNLRGAPGTDDWNDIGGTKSVASDSAFNLVSTPGSSGGIVHGSNGNIVGQSETNGSRVRLSLESIIDVNLADNGGPTLTHALIAGSPAINSGSILLAAYGDGSALLTDQRGALRVTGLFIDIGAYEVGALEL